MDFLFWIVLKKINTHLNCNCWKYIKVVAPLGMSQDCARPGWMNSENLLKSWTFRWIPSFRFWLPPIKQHLRDKLVVNLLIIIRRLKAPLDSRVKLSLKSFHYQRTPCFLPAEQNINNWKRPLKYHPTFDNFSPFEGSGNETLQSLFRQKRQEKQDSQL